jgi:tetratricopeptide (TPR) repeat protein
MYAQRALAIDPDLARAHAALGEIHCVKYEYREAVPEFREAIRLQPDEPSYHDNLSWALGYLTPPDGPASEASAREAIRLSPGFGFAYYHLGRALLAQGKVREAKEAFTYGGELTKSTDTMNLGLGLASLAEGDYAKAADLFDGQANITPLHMVYQAAAWTGQGRKEQALARLTEAVNGGYRDAPFLEWSPWFDPLRSDPRFTKALEVARQR